MATPVEFTDRLDAEIASVEARLDEQKKHLKKATNTQTASTELRALVTRLEVLEETRRKIKEQQHGG